MLLHPAKFSEQYPPKRHLDFKKVYTSCQEKLTGHFAKKGNVNVVKSCTNRRLRKSEEEELNVILDPILNIPKPRKVCKFIERSSGGKVVCKKRKFVGEGFKKSIRRFKVEGFVCVPSLYKYDKEDPKLVRTLSDSCVHYKVYTSVRPEGGSCWDRKIRTAPKISVEDHRSHKSELSKDTLSEHATELKPSKTIYHPTKQSALKISNITGQNTTVSFQNPMRSKIFSKQLRNLQTSYSGSTDDIIRKDFTHSIRETAKLESATTKNPPLTNKITAPQEKRCSNLVASIKQTIAALKEREKYTQDAKLRELSQVHDDEFGVKNAKFGLSKSRGAGNEKIEGKTCCGNCKSKSLNCPQITKEFKKSLPMQKISKMSTCLPQIRNRKNGSYEISESSSGSFKTANSVISQRNPSNFSESSDTVEREVRKLTSGWNSEGKNLNEVPNGKKFGKIERNPGRTPLRVMNYSFEGHVTFPAKSSVREKLKSRPVDRSKLSIVVGRAEGAKEDGQYRSNFGLKASKSHFDLTTALRGTEGIQHGGRRK